MFTSWASIVVFRRKGLLIKSILTSHLTNTSILKHTMHGTLTNQETLAEVDEVKEEDSHDEQNENDDGELVAKPGIEEVRNAVKFLKDFHLFLQFGKSLKT